MNGHELRSEIYEILILLILTVEYFWGRSDTDIKREAVRKKKQKLEETQKTPVSMPGEIK